MKEIGVILFKTIIAYYYRRNAWWMLLLLMAFFGLIQNPILLHHMLMVYIGRTPNAMFAYIMVNTLYMCYIVWFQIRSLQKKENDFLHLLCLLNKWSLSFIIIGTQLLLMLPLLVYSLFTLVVLFNTHLYGAFMILVAGITILIGIGFLLIKRKISNNISDIKTFHLTIKLPHFFESYICSYIWNYKRNNLLWSKIFSLLILSIPLVRNNDNFQLSDFAIFWSVSLAANLILLRDIFIFHNTKMRYIRQLPIPTIRIFLQIVFSCFVFMIPEILLVWFYRGGLVGFSFFQYTIYSFGAVLFLYNLQWEKQMNFASFMGISSLILLLQLLFLIPYKQFILLGCIYVIIAAFLFVYNYYNFEYIAEETNDKIKIRN